MLPFDALNQSKLRADLHLPVPWQVVITTSHNYRTSLRERTYSKHSTVTQISTSQTQNTHTHTQTQYVIQVKRSKNSVIVEITIHIYEVYISIM